MEMFLVANIFIGLIVVSHLKFSVAETSLDWIKEAVDRHNIYRKGFNAPPLVVNPEVSIQQCSIT